LDNIIIQNYSFVFCRTFENRYMISRACRRYVFFLEKNNLKTNIRKSKSDKQRAMIWSELISQDVSRPRNFSRTGFIIPRKIARRPLSTWRAVLYARIHANCQIYYDAGRVCIWESEFRERIHPIDCPFLPPPPPSMWISSISRPLSSPFSRRLRRLLNFTPLSWRYQQSTCLSRTLRRRDRRRRDKMIDIGLLIFRDNVA